ncbi:hypothetical protein [Flavobacterium sp. SM2513]|uniref:hypothetical protein n=1 Tax=Flavobacterium sp. SM2513 TaxID=3424766 RepID=UPI003D7F7571
MNKIFIIAISSVVLISCKNDKQTTTSEETPEMEQVQEEHSESIQLNNNEKWPVNEEMKPYVMQGEAVVNSYLETNNTDYAALATQLKDLNTKLIKSCTMDGKSHDELHKWLHPHLELVEKLGNTTDPAAGKSATQEVSDSYKSYHQYFN